MPAPIHNITILVTGDKTVTMPLRCKIIYPFAIHRRVKKRGEEWITDNAPNTRGYVATHLLTGKSIVTIMPRWAGGRMIECKNKLVGLVERLSGFPDFLLADTQQVTNGPNRQEITEMIRETKGWV
tara:strand:- start:487 stop:864 length:378 start_codon:yes stop_codon:yes gene_type:complete